MELGKGQRNTGQMVHYTPNVLKCVVMKKRGEAKQEKYQME